MILVGCRNLEDMGLSGCIMSFTKYVIHGKGASDVLDSWKRKMTIAIGRPGSKRVFALNPLESWPSSGSVRPSTS
jgi:hypothetical protein